MLIEDHQIWVCVPLCSSKIYPIDHHGHLGKSTAVRCIVSVLANCFLSRDKIPHPQCKSKMVYLAHSLHRVPSMIGFKADGSAERHQRVNPSYGNAGQAEEART